MSRSSSRLRRGLAGLALIAVTGTGCTPLDDAMVAIFGRSMRDQRSFDPYEQPLLPAEHSVPFASGNNPAEAGEVQIGQGVPGIDVPPFTQADLNPPPGSAVVQGLQNPIPMTEESLQRGELLYQRYCAVCHGDTGLSADAPVAEKFPTVLAYNLATGNTPGYPDGYIYGMIRVGRGMMPPYGPRVPHFDRWHIVNYVRHLQEETGSAAGGAAGGAGAAAGDTAAAAADTVGGEG